MLNGILHMAVRYANEATKAYYHQFYKIELDFTGKTYILEHVFRSPTSYKLCSRISSQLFTHSDRAMMCIVEKPDHSNVRAHFLNTELHQAKKWNVDALKNVLMEQPDGEMQEYVKKIVDGLEKKADLNKF